MRKKGKSMLETVEKISIDSSLEILGRKITFNKRRDYLILGVVLIIFVGAFYSWYLDNQPHIALGEIKSITVGETLWATGVYRADLERIISNASGTFAVFCKYVDPTESKTYMYIPVGSTFSIYTLTFKVVSVRISDNIVVVQRIS
jgi:hypothetical protein